MQRHFEKYKLYRVVETTNSLKERKKFLSYFREVEVAIFQKTYKNETKESVELSTLSYFGITNDTEIQVGDVIEINNLIYEVTNIPLTKGFRRTLFLDKEVNYRVI